MLNFNEELEKFQPCADLEDAEENIYGEELKEIKKNKTELYKANQIIKKYNQALNYAKQGNDDLAMLQLKNVVSAIPNFEDAYLLMALLSIKAEDYESAKESLDSILAINPENESAKEYIKEFQIEADTAEAAEENTESMEKMKKASKPQKIKNPFKSESIQSAASEKSPMFYMVTGLIIGIIVSTALIYPTVKASFTHKNSSQVEDYKEQILAKDTQLKANEKKIKDAEEAQEKAEKELEEYIGTSKKDGIYDLLLTALQQYADKNYTESADALLDIDSKKLTTKNMKNIYKDLTQKVYPNAKKGLYNKGLNMYYTKDYKSAISYFQKVIEIDESDVSAYYYLARTYEDNGDKEKAVKAYNNVIKKFPGTRSARNSESRMNALQQKKSKNL